MGNVVKTMLLVLWLGCMSHALGQKVDSAYEGRPLEEGKILTEYAPSDGATLMRIEPLFLYHEEVPAGQVIKNWLNMTAAFSYKGKKPAAPSKIVLGFGSSSEKGCKFPNSIEFEITFVADGEPIKIGSVFSFNEPALDGSCTESLMAWLPPETFVRIPRAKRVELRVAETSVVLKESHLKALRNFANRIKP